MPQQNIKKSEVPGNNCVIECSSRRADDELLCYTCSTVRLDRYEACLDIAGNSDWPGWRMVSGEWCESLKIEIEKQAVRDSARSGFG